MSTAARVAISWVEQGYVPDNVIRHGIRRLLRQRLAELDVGDCAAVAQRENQFVRMMDTAAIAPLPQLANEQHYEVPAEFFDEVLGEHRKYSSCYWPSATTTLDEAEFEALRISAERAELSDGQSILELGCGWGSLSLWMAENYPGSRVTSVSNSQSQRAYIETQASQRGLQNLTVITADMNEFDISERFDRVVSVEMFEHMRNYRRLFARINEWLNPGGKFFMHIFCHRSAPYEFVDNGPSDWMSRHFFSGGIMPSDALPLRFQDHLRLHSHWRWDGRHYERTLNAWLERMDARRDNVWPILVQTYGQDQAHIWWMRWRMFFMACAELFGFNDGQEWYVGHYLFAKPTREQDAAS